VNRNGVYRGVAPCAPVGASRGSLTRWASFTGEWLERQGIGMYSGYDLRSAGVVVGMDMNFSRSTFGGIAFGYDNAHQSFQTIRADNSIDAFRTALYGGIRSGSIFADGYFGYTKNWNKTCRDINVGTFNETARSKFDDGMFSLGMEVGRKLSFGRTNLTPSIGLHYINLSTPTITESGAGDANLLVHSHEYNSLRIPVGATLSRDIVGGRMTWTPEARVFYVREMADASVRTGTSFATVSSVPFYAESGSWGCNSGRFGLGLNAQLSNRLNVRVDYDYEVYDHTTADAFTATLGVKW